MAIMHARGVPVPEIIEQGEAAGQRYVVYEQMPGRRPGKVSEGVLRELVAVVELERNKGPRDAGSWRSTLRSMLYSEGDPLV